MTQTTRECCGISFFEVRNSSINVTGAFDFNNDIDIVEILRAVNLVIYVFSLPRYLYFSEDFNFQ